MSTPASEPEPGVTPDEVLGEVRDFLQAHEQRRRLIPRAMLVGLLSGLVAVAFRWTLNGGEFLREELLRAAHRVPALGWLVPVLFGAGGAALSVWLVRSVAPEASGSGIPHLKAVLHHLRGMHWRRILPVKFAGGALAISGGLALGREGPTVQMGGAVGQMVSQLLGSTPRERQTLIAAGAGAGIAGAFNAPLAGLVFVLEEVQRDFAPTVFTAAFVASVTADVVTRGLTGQLPAFHVEMLDTPSLTALPVSVVLGGIAGLLGVLFNRTLLGTLNLFQRLRRWRPWVLGAVVGGAVGLVGWFAPDTLGGGHHLAEAAMTGHTSLAALPALFGLRFVLTMGSYGTGAPGGIFAPLLVLGAQLGLATGLVTQRLFPWMVEHPQVFAVVGMGALFTAIVRAPLTGIVLMIEMTGNYALILPLLAACMTAYGVADLLRDLPVYEALLERDLLRGQDARELEDTLLLELSLQAGAPFDGKRVRDLGLPPGCILVTVRRGLTDLVPTADMALAAGDRVTAVIAPSATAALPRLREGMGHG